MPLGEMDAGTSGARLLGGRYELRRLLGTGGSGAVHLAHDTLLKRSVAVKLLHVAHDDIARARLRAEARIAASLTHPGIARLLDLGEDSIGGVAAPYLVMEYVEGRTLRDLIRAGERLSVEQAVTMIAQLADALAAVHGAGIVHRDLKPGNIMLAPEGRAVLLDFGIARHHDLEPLTLTGTIVGTVDYISPEQASGASATGASDLYALGMVAYESLTGVLPLSRDTQVSTLMAHAGTPVPPLPATFPAGVRELVEGMVALDPGQRPPSAAAVAQHAQALLKDACATRPVAVPPPVPPRRSRRRRAMTAACAGVVVAVGCLAWFSLGRGADPVVPPAGAVVSPGGSPGSTPSGAAQEAPSPSGTPAAATVLQQKRPATPSSKAHAAGQATKHHRKNAAHTTKPGHATKPAHAKPGRPGGGKGSGKGKGHAEGHGHAPKKR